MRIEQIDRQTVKVILTQADMDGFDITYEEMDYKDPNTRRVILELLRRIKDEMAVDFSGGKLFVEAFPYLDGGCVLYICTITAEGERKPRSRNTNSFNTPLVFEFGELGMLTAACERLLLRYNHIILKSALYLYENKYRLLLYSYFKLDDKLVALVGEYGSYIGKGSIQSSFVREHAKCLIEANAVETLASLQA